MPRLGRTRAVKRWQPAIRVIDLSASAGNDIVRFCGGAAALLGEPEKARVYYQQAIDICTKVRFRPELALTRLELAELMLSTGDGSTTRVRPHPNPHPQGEGGQPEPSNARAEALGHLDFAIAEFREMKMQPSLERALRHREVLKA